MGKVQKKDWIFVSGFGLAIGLVNVFSHRVLEIDYRSQELLEMQFGDLKWFLLGAFTGMACYVVLYLINVCCDFRKSKTTVPISGSKCFWSAFALTFLSWSLQLLADNPCFLMGDTTYIIEYGLGMAVQHPLIYVLFLAGGYSYLPGLPTVFHGRYCC